MGIWFKDVEDYDSAAQATRGGMFGALGYAAWVAFSVGITFATTDAALYFGWLTPLGQALFIGFIGGQIGIALLAAWRFSLGKGAIAGSLNALVLVAVVVFEIATGSFHGIIWYVLLLGILMALINGVRGAMARGPMHNPEEMVEAFE